MSTGDDGVSEEVLREEREELATLLGDGDHAVAPSRAGALAADEGGEEVVGRTALVGRGGGPAEDVDALAPGSVVAAVTDAEVVGRGGAWVGGCVTPDDLASPGLCGAVEPCVGLDQDDGAELRRSRNGGSDQGANHGAARGERGGARHGGAHAGGEGRAFGGQELASIGSDQQSCDGSLQSRECEGSSGDGQIEACGLQERELGLVEVGFDACQRWHEAERVCAPEALKGVELGGEGGCAHVEDEEGGLCRSCVEIEPVGIVKSEDAAACDRASGAAHGLLDRDGSLDGTNHPNGPALALKGRIRAFRRSRL